MKHVLVTGGCGFIGSNFIRYLLRNETWSCPERIVNVDALTYAGSVANVADVAADIRYRFVQADVRDEDAMYALLHENGITAVVHFAAESHVDRSIDTPEAFFQTNLIGTLRLLNAFRRHWAASGQDATLRFLHVSTDEVYGSLGAEDPAFHENSE